MSSPFDYFEGGKSGVVDRLVNAVRKPLAKMNLSAMQDLEEHLGLPAGILYRLWRDSSGELIDSRMIQALAVPLGFSFRECFKPKENLTPEEIDAFAGLAQLVPIAPAGGVRWEFPERDLLAVTMIDLALEELENTPRVDGDGQG
jgi:hypothetical protein